MALADSHRVALATVAGDVDLSTAQGRLVARLKGSVAAHEIEQMKARMRRRHQQKAEQGVPHWSRAFGYLDDGTHQPDPHTAPLVKQAYAAVLAGASLADVCRMWNDAAATTPHGNPWTAQAVSAFLRKPRNCGLRAHNGEIVVRTAEGPDGTTVTETVRGTWPPLIDEPTWRAAQTVLDGAQRPPTRP